MTLRGKSDKCDDRTSGSLPGFKISGDDVKLAVNPRVIWSHMGISVALEEEWDKLDRIRNKRHKKWCLGVIQDFELNDYVG